jgi:hypothetical protein
MEGWISEHKKREDARIARLAVGGVGVGQTFRRHINQADRFCLVVAVSGTRYAYVYEMPAGGRYSRVGDTATQTERTVSAARLPRWAKGAFEEMLKREGR